jgi:hypothetical protein
MEQQLKWYKRVSVLRLLGRNEGAAAAFRIGSKRKTSRATLTSGGKAGDSFAGRLPSD